jgi:hypothetical protein
MKDRKKFILQEFGVITCPKCGKGMVECVQEDMTEGQEADYDAGFNHPYECQDCGYWGLFDVESIYAPEEEDKWEDPEIEELIKINKVDASSFEEIIENALKSKCFIEAISLIHNVIEVYLRSKIELFISGDETRLQLLKEKFKPEYLKDYNLICYLFGLIKKEDYKNMNKFNKDRNNVIHELLKRSMTIEKMKNIAKNGRKIQLKLSPLNHSEEDIKKILKEFDKLTK